MIKIIHGKVHGRTIEFAEELGLAEGQEVEVSVRTVSNGEARTPGEGLLRTEGALLQKRLDVSRMDQLIASVALVHNLTLVTHNKADYQNVPGLRLVDWLIP